MQLSVVFVMHCIPASAIVLSFLILVPHWAAVPPLHLHSWVVRIKAVNMCVLGLVVCVHTMFLQFSVKTIHAL